MPDAAGYRVVIELEGAPELPNAIGRKHWRVQDRHTAFWRTMVVRSVGHRRPPEPLPRASVKVEVWRKRRPDPLNLVASVKPVIDGLVPSSAHKRGNQMVRGIGCGIIADDQAKNFEGGSPRVVFHQCAKGERPHVRITVESV